MLNNNSNPWPFPDDESTQLTEFKNDNTHSQVCCEVIENKEEVLEKASIEKQTPDQKIEEDTLDNKITKKFQIEHKKNRYNYSSESKGVLYYRCAGSRKCRGRLILRPKNDRYVIEERSEHVCNAFSKSREMCREIMSVDLTPAKEEFSDNNYLNHNYLNNNEVICKKSALNITEKKLRELIRLDPFQTTSYFYEHPYNKSNDVYIFNESKIERMKVRIKQELYPKQPEILFGGDFTRTLSDKSQFLQVRHILPTKFINKINDEIIFFTSPFQFSLLQKADIAFLDGTFQITPKPYIQTLVLLVLNTETNIYTPVVYAVLSSKSKEIYEDFFLILLSQQYKFDVQMKITKIVLDLEPGLHSAVHKVFPNLQVIPCYFHYVKLLWKRTVKEDIRDKDCVGEFINTLKVLVHLDKNLQKILWKTIIEKFGDQKGFKNFIQYYYDNFLKPGTIWSKCVNYSQLMDQNEIFVRSNNAIEGYNNRLRIKMKFQNPSMGHFIKILLHEEDYYKVKTRKIAEKIIPKPQHPNHIDEMMLNIPVSKTLNIILNALNKKEQAQLIKCFDAHVFDTMINTTLGMLKNFNDEIIKTIFEEDLEEGFDLKYNEIDPVKLFKLEGMANGIKKRKLDADIMTDAYFINPKDF